MTASAPLSLLDQALAAHKSGDLARADSLYLSILAANPQNAEAHHLLAVLRHGKGDDISAHHHASIASQLDPGNPYFANTLGLISLRQGKLDDAESHLRRALVKLPDAAEIHFNLAESCRELGKLTPAITHFRRTIALKPDFAAAHLELALTLASTGADLAAESALEDAETLIGDTPELHATRLKVAEILHAVQPATPQPIPPVTSLPDRIAPVTRRVSYAKAAIFGGQRDYILRNTPPILTLWHSTLPASTPETTPEATLAKGQGLRLFAASFAGALLIGMCGFWLGRMLPITPTNTPPASVAIAPVPEPTPEPSEPPAIVTILPEPVKPEPVQPALIQPVATPVPETPEPTVTPVIVAAPAPEPKALAPVVRTPVKAPTKPPTKQVAKQAAKQPLKRDDAYRPPPLPRTARLPPPQPVTINPDRTLPAQTIAPRVERVVPPPVLRPPVSSPASASPAVDSALSAAIRANPDLTAAEKTQLLQELPSMNASERANLRIMLGAQDNTLR